MSKKRLGVIGVGSAGIISLCHFCTWLGNDWEVVSIHDPNVPILGIGESTNGGFVGLLERATHFALGNPEDLKLLDATLKFGSRFRNWRENDWLNPLLDGNMAIHFDSSRLHGFAKSRLANLWPDKFRTIEGHVDAMENGDSKVTFTLNGRQLDFDYVIDCTGYPTDMTDYAMSNCSPVNRCLIHNDREHEVSFETDHIATPDGWMFGVPLQSRKTYGYLFNDKITSPEVAASNMKTLLGVDVRDGGEYRFDCFFTTQLIDGRICKCGNKALFFEPLVANSIFLYLHIVRLIFDHIVQGVSADEINARFVHAAQQMEDVISYYYKGGSSFETPFWKTASTQASRRLKTREAFKQLWRDYAGLKNRGLLHYGEVYALAPLTWEIVDAALGYDSYSISQ